MTTRTGTKPAPSLLVEIGTEELPPKALSKLGRTFADACQQALAAANLLEDPHAPHRWFATPRRLAVHIPGVRKRQPDQRLERRGPAVTAAFDDQGNPTKAAIGFSKSCGVELNQLATLRDGKGEWLVHRAIQRGKTANALIPQCVEQSIKQLPIPKRMRWGSGAAEFVRPAHWVVLLHGASVVKAKLLSIMAGASTRGHRFHCPRRLQLTNADRYESVLQETGYVVPDFAVRRRLILQKIQRLAKRVDGAPMFDEELLDEVTGLVEWPVSIIGEFEQSFLSVPHEVLVSSMRDHQKYFPVTDSKGQLLPYFITISNIKSKNPARVRQGNERVLKARLSDARFFWETDRKLELVSRVDALKDVMFHKKLGSLFDKTDRVRKLSSFIAALLGVNIEHCDRAALLAKADLVTDMVGEFPELQGVMGRYYAVHDGEPGAVSTALEEHYQPRYAGDQLPVSPVGQVVAAADKLDSLVGIFAAGEEPSGDKDPYGLRRAALGILRILIEKHLDLDLRHLLKESARLYELATQSIAVDDEIVMRLLEFLLERLRAYYSTAGFKLDEINAVTAVRPTRPLDFDRRVRAVAEFRKLPQAVNLSAANKRIRNILRQTSEAIPGEVDRTALTEPAERDLFDALEQLSKVVSHHFQNGDYDKGLAKLVSLKEPVDYFFDKVLVMTKDIRFRRNRLALLRQVQTMFLQTADISKLQVSTK